MRENIEKLISSGIPAYRVAKETGIPTNTTHRIFTGEAKLDNVTLKNAEMLNDYYIKLKEMEKMMEISLRNYGYSNSSEIVVSEEIVNEINKFYGWDDTAKVIRHIESDVVEILEDEENGDGEYTEELVFAKEDYIDASTYKSIAFKATFSVDGDSAQVTITK